MLCVLNITSGPRAGEKVWLRSDEFLQVGRDPAADLALVYDSHMSRVHFALEGIENGFRIRDLGSTNGTFLNGVQIQLAALNNGDRIVAGKTSYSIEITQDVKLASSDSTNTGPPVAQPLPPTSVDDQTMVVDERRPVSEEETVKTTYRAPQSQDQAPQEQATNQPLPPQPPVPLADDASSGNQTQQGATGPISSTQPAPATPAPATPADELGQMAGPPPGTIPSAPPIAPDAPGPADLVVPTNDSPEAIDQHRIAGTTRLAEGATPIRPGDGQIRVDTPEEVVPSSAPVANEVPSTSDGGLQCIESTSPHFTVAQVAHRLAKDSTMMAVVNRTQLDAGAQGMIEHAVARQHAWPISDTLYVVDDGQAARVGEIMERSVGRDAAICIGVKKGWNLVVAELRRQASLFSYPSMLFDELQYTADNERARLFGHIRFMLFERDSTASWVLISEPNFELPEDIRSAVGGIRARTIGTTT